MLEHRGRARTEGREEVRAAEAALEARVGELRQRGACERKVNKIFLKGRRCCVAVGRAEVAEPVQLGRGLGQRVLALVLPRVLHAALHHLRGSVGLGAFLKRG